MIAYVSGILLLCEAGLLLLPLAIAFIYGDSTISSFLVTIGALTVSGLLLASLKPADKTIYARDGLVIVALGWILLSLFGALPFFISGEIPKYIDALFETVSGFTTTGASILNDIEALSKSLLFWRSFTHWIGGMGVLVFVMAVLPLAGGGGNIHLMRAESPGPNVGKFVPKSNKTARILYLIYFAMTITCIILLKVGGMSLFESITLSFGAAGTGGFGVLNDSIASYSPYCQNVLTVFMALFGINFNLYFLLMFKRFKEALKCEEVWIYLGIMLSSITIIAFNISSQFETIRQAFHHSAFQVASIMTTTGYSNVDFNKWPELSRMILVMLMCIGACAGSTGGGFKVSRVILMLKHASRELRSISHPRSVKALKFEGSVIKTETIRSTTAYLVIYVAIFCVSVLLVSFDKTDTVTNITGVIANLNNIGPNLGPRLLSAVDLGHPIGGPFSNYSIFNDFSKFVFIADMLLGRLELFPLIILFTPSTNLKRKISHRKRL